MIKEWSDAWLLKCAKELELKVVLVELRKEVKNG